MDRLLDEVLPEATVKYDDLVGSCSSIKETVDSDQNGKHGVRPMFHIFSRKPEQRRVLILD